MASPLVQYLLRLLAVVVTTTAESHASGFSHSSVAEEADTLLGFRRRSKQEQQIFFIRVEIASVVKHITWFTKE